MNVITSIVVVVGLYLFIWKQRIGDLIVWILETVFDMKHEAAFYYYSDHFRGNKEIFFAVAVLLRMSAAPSATKTISSQRKDPHLSGMSYWQH